MHATVDSALDPRTDALAGEWLSLKETADRLGIKPNRIKQLISEHRLLAVRRGSEPMVPAAFVKDGQVIKGLPGTLTLLSDAASTTSRRSGGCSPPTTPCRGRPSRR